MADRALCNRCGRYVDLVFNSEAKPMFSYRRDVSVSVIATCSVCGTVLYSGVQGMTLQSQQTYMDYQVEEK